VRVGDLAVLLRIDLLEHNSPPMKKPFESAANNISVREVFRKVRERRVSCSGIARSARNGLRRRLAWAEAESS
jgi:hypothetical protein